VCTACCHAFAVLRNRTAATNAINKNTVDEKAPTAAISNPSFASVANVKRSFMIEAGYRFG
jgi:hypothetical protein